MPHVFVDIYTQGDAEHGHDAHRLQHVTGCCLLCCQGSAETLGALWQGVWDLCWAEDSAELLAISEREALYILRSGRPEEPVPTAARLCAFTDLQVTVPALPVQHTKSSLFCAAC